MPEPTATPTPGGYEFNPGDTGRDGGATQPAVAPGASQGETVLLHPDNGYPIRIQQVAASDPARQLTGPYIARYLDNGEVIQFPPGEYIGNDKKYYTLGADGSITQGATVKQSVFDEAQGGPRAALGGDGTGTTGSGPTGDPFAAGYFALAKYQKLYDARAMTVDEAMDAWDADWNEIVSNSNIESTNVANQLAADTSNATLAGNRAADIALNQSRLNQEATERAKLKNTILKGAVPHGTEVNFSGFGKVPTHPINMEQFLSGGIPSLKDQFGGLDALFPRANIQPGTVAPVKAPPMPTLPPMPALPF